MIRTNSMVNDQLLKLSGATVKSLVAMCFCDARIIKQLQWFKQCSSTVATIHSYTV